MLYINSLNTRKLTRLSLLIALSIILTRILSLRIAVGGVEGVRIGFGALPVIFAGFAFGPLAGGIVGAISDLAGYFINPMGAYMPHFTFTAFLTGFIPAFVLYKLGNNNKNYFLLLISILIGQVISSIILVPLFIKLLFEVPLKVTMVSKLISQAIIVPINAYICKVLFNYDVIKIERRT
mgnify:CR=1 FL=1